VKQLEDYLYYEEENPSLKIYCGDCLEILPLLPKVDLVVTDPPYGMNWKFTGQGTGKKSRGTKTSKTKNETVLNDDKEFDPAFLLKNGARVILWGFHHFPQHLHRGSVFVWVKKYEDAYGTFLSDADLAWMNSGCGVYISPALNPALFQNDKHHPTQKPVSLMSWCIEKSKVSGVVADPFLGSGTTLVACKELNRNGIGIEISEKYCAIAKQRLKATTKSLF
jgi:DNA modification methylase